MMGDAWREPVIAVGCVLLGARVGAVFVPREVPEYHGAVGFVTQLDKQTETRFVCFRIHVFPKKLNNEMRCVLAYFFL